MRLSLRTKTLRFYIVYFGKIFFGGKYLNTRVSQIAALVARRNSQGVFDTVTIAEKLLEKFDSREIPL